jgi:hypothetical protein
MGAGLRPQQSIYRMWCTASCMEALRGKSVGAVARPQQGTQAVDSSYGTVRFIYGAG